MLTLTRTTAAPDLGRLNNRDLLQLWRQANLQTCRLRYVPHRLTPEERAAAKRLLPTFRRATAEVKARAERMGHGCPVRLAVAYCQLTGKWLR